MTSGEVTVTIAAPPERIWPWVADLGKHAVRRGIEIERQGLLLCGERCVAHGGQIRSARWVLDGTVLWRGRRGR